MAPYCIMPKSRSYQREAICRHEIFPEFSRPQKSFSWKSQIRFNIYGGGGGGCTLNCDTVYFLHSLKY